MDQDYRDMLVDQFHRNIGGLHVGDAHGDGLGHVDIHKDYDPSDENVIVRCSGLNQRRKLL